MLFYRELLKELTDCGLRVNSLKANVFDSQHWLLPGPGKHLRSLQIAGSEILPA